MNIIGAALIFASLAVVATLAQEEVLGDGRPGCQTDEELKVEIYRNFWDPTAYWRCTTRGIPALSLRCGPNLAFLNSNRACVPWDHWTWEAPIAPPSAANFDSGEK